MACVPVARRVGCQRMGRCDIKGFWFGNTRGCDVAEFLFDSGGSPVAFRRDPDDKFLWDPDGNWIGWFPWGDSDAVDTEGEYLGTVVGNRLLHRTSQPYRGYPGYPGYPGFAGYPGYGGFAGYAGYLPGFEDVESGRLKGN